MRTHERGWHIAAALLVGGFLAHIHAGAAGASPFPATGLEQGGDFAVTGLRCTSGPEHVSCSASAINAPAGRTVSWEWRIDTRIVSGAGSRQTDTPVPGGSSSRLEVDGVTPGKHAVVVWARVINWVAGDNANIVVPGGGGAPPVTAPPQAPSPSTATTPGPGPLAQGTPPQVPTPPRGVLSQEFCRDAMNKAALIVAMIGGGSDHPGDDEFLITEALPAYFLLFVRCDKAGFISPPEAPLAVDTPQGRSGPGEPVRLSPATPRVGVLNAVIVALHRPKPATYTTTEGTATSTLALVAQVSPELLGAGALKSARAQPAGAQASVTFVPEQPQLYSISVPGAPYNPGAARVAARSVIAGGVTLRLQEGALRVTGQEPAVGWSIRTGAGTISAVGRADFTAAYSPQEHRVTASVQSGSLLLTPSDSRVAPVRVQAGSEAQWTSGQGAIAFGGATPAPATWGGTSPDAGFAGSWKTTWGDWGQITLSVSGSRVSGYYGGDGSPATASGSLEGAADGRVARLKWRDRNGVNWGGAMFTLSIDGNTLTGHRNDWKEPDVAMYKWNAERIRGAVASFPPASAPAAVPAPAQGFAGSWKTTWGDWGQITLSVSGSRVSGYYGGDGSPATASGSLEGAADGRVARLKWRDRNGVNWGGAMFTLGADGNTLTGHRNDWKDPDVAMYKWNAERIR